MIKMFSIAVVFRQAAMVMLAMLVMLSTPALTEEARFAEIESLIKSNDAVGLAAALKARPQLASTRTPAGISALAFAAYTERPEMVRIIRAHRTQLDFHEACIVGDTATIRRQLALGQDVNQRSRDGFVPLALAIFFQQPDAARLLMDAGADLNLKATNSFQVAPIHAAVARGDLKSLQALLLRGADPDLPQQRMMRPLHEAAAAGNLPAIALLLMFGADVSLRNEEGKSPADFARENGHLELAKRVARPIDRK
jgi:ankyrin repeat protein